MERALVPEDERLTQAYQGVRTLVTGGTGFIGGHLVDELVASGADVTVLDDLSSSDTAHLAPLIDRHPDRVRLVYASVLDPDAMADAVDDVELCFHLGALASVPSSIEEPQRAYDVNTLGTVRVLEACRRAGVKRVVSASTAAVYAPLDAGALRHARREHERPAPTSPYGASKLGAEHAVASHATSYPIDAVSLRYFNVIGPRQPERGAYASVVPAFVGAIQRGEPSVIYGDGSATRDFVSIRDAVRANMLAGIRRTPFRGIALNVGSGTSTSVRHLHETLRTLCARPGAEVRHEPERAGDLEHSLADTSLATEELGFSARHSLEDELREILVSVGITPSDPANKG